MTAPSTPLRGLPTAALFAVVVLVYAALARFGESILPLDGIAALWPASGFAAVMLFWAETRWRRVVVLLAIMFGVGVSIFIRGELYVNELGYLLGNLVEPLVMLPFLARATRPDGRMDRMASVMWLVLGAALATASAGAVVATLATWSFDGTGDFASTWPITWRSFTSGDVLGLLLVAPLMLQARPLNRLWSRGTPAEQIALWSALGGTIVLATYSPVWVAAGLVVVIIMSLRLDSSAASLGALVISAVLVTFFLRGGGDGAGEVTAVDLRLVLPLVAILTQLVSLSTTERLAATSLAEAARNDAEAARATLRRALDSGLDAFAIYEASPSGAWELIFVNTIGASRSGVSADDLRGTTPEHVMPVEAVPRVLDLMDEALRSGASQQIVADLTGGKSGWRGDFDITVTPMAGGRVVVSWRDVSDVQAAQRSLRSAHAAAMHAATHDALTNLPNRPMLLDRMTTALSALPRTHDLMAVVYLDVDNFKSINDRFGHAMGDTVLISVAQRLRQLTREGDTAARISGDEFVLVLTGVDARWDPVDFQGRLAAAVGDPIERDGVSLNISVSAGVALADSTARTPEELLHEADLALYASKGEGRGRLTVFTETLRQAGSPGRPSSAELADALSHGGLLLAKQPVVDLSTGDVVGHEALVRWNHPLYGVLSPGQFLDLAEISGLIADVGEWVLRDAIRGLADQDDRTWVSVNLAPTQLMRAAVAVDARRWCEEFGLAPDRLVFELTESQLLDATPAVLGQLDVLRDLGCRLAIDDFGSGYSSIAYLEAFEFDIIKIDRGLLQGALTERKLAMLSWIAGLAETFGCVTLAEGIENEEQANLIRSAGVDWGQGFLFGRPELVPSAPGLHGVN